MTLFKEKHKSGAINYTHVSNLYTELDISRNNGYPLVENGY